MDDVSTALTLTGPKAILLATEIATEGDIPALRSLIHSHKDCLPKELVLRILLTFLPETTEPDNYVSFLHELFQSSTELAKSPQPVNIDTSSVDSIADNDLIKRIHQLHLLQLGRPVIAVDAEKDPLSAFLIQRSYRIDAESGLISSLPELIVPFIERSELLRIWLISTLLPLLRLCYEYYPHGETALDLATFSNLDDSSAVETLLSRSQAETVVRDLRNLVGAWMYGSGKGKNRRPDNIVEGLTPNSAVASVNHGDNVEMVTSGATNGQIQIVYKWLVTKSSTDYALVVNALEGWGGLGDADYGGYAKEDRPSGGQSNWQYAQAALASIFNTPEASLDSLRFSNRVLLRVSQLLDEPSPPMILEQETPKPLPSRDLSRFRKASNIYLDTRELLLSRNVFTNPSQDTLLFLHIIIQSLATMLNWCQPLSIKAAVKIYISGPTAQAEELQRILHAFTSGAKREDVQWRRLRSYIMWLWSGGAEGSRGQGLFGSMDKSDVEKEILGSLLTGLHYQEVIESYILNPVLPVTVVNKAVYDAAMRFYDNASNGNKTRGGVKKALSIVHAFYPDYLPDSILLQNAEALISATHSLSFYSLTLQRGVPFKPVNIRAHNDPISLLEKVLEQNSRSYTRLDDLISIAENLVVASYHDARYLPQNVKDATRRVMGMAIEAALSEDDFDTAYSYVLNRLTPTSSDTSIDQDDLISWRAAYQAGRYQSSQSSTTTGLRLIEMRLELLSIALLIAPSAALAEILSQWRRCEEKMISLLMQEAEEEEEHDDRGDGRIPGSFMNLSSKPSRKDGGRSGKGVGVPMGLFDVARGAASAISRSAFPLHGSANTTAVKSGGRKTESVTVAPVAQSGVDVDARVRKRDVVSNMVTGGLASGIGWVLGATPAQEDGDEK